MRRHPDPSERLTLTDPPADGLPLTLAPVLVAFAVAATLAGCEIARAATVSGLGALHRDGQTFVIWTAPAGSGWRYRLYRAESPITSPGQLVAGALVGAVGDSTWCDRRLSQLRGQTYGHRVDSLGSPLDSTRGLIVVTAAADRASYYAVTAQQGAGAEDLTVVPGGNALASPVTELVALPRPVWQRTLTAGATTFDVYTTWTSPADTPLFPATSTAYGLAFDHALVRGAPGGPLHMRPHARGGNFLLVLGGSGEPGEWRVALDDYLYASSDRNSFWYGYHDAYDLFDATPSTPAAGTVQDYTLRRIVHTFAWARRELPVDTTRAIASGGSMGAIGSFMLAYRVPGWLAGVHGTVPKFDFGYDSDPNPANIWNAGSPERSVADHLWGALPGGLPTGEGFAAYDRLDLGFMAGQLEAVSLPVMMAFNGRYDTVVGWGEKIGYYAATQAHRHGGYYWFDNRTHNGTDAAWAPIQGVRYLYRFRTNRSYPALSGCSADDDPGDGNAASGDSVGSLNGAIEWDPELLDTPTSWQVTLATRAQVTTWGVFPAPESLLVDVTPRRLQAFTVAPGGAYPWRVERLGDGALLATGVAVADTFGLVTVPGVRVLREGVRLLLGVAGALDAGGAAVPARLALAAPAVARGRATLAVSWASAEPAEVAVFDLAGRRVRTLFAGVPSAAAQSLVLDLAGEPAGVLFVRARQGGAAATAKVVALR